jgi:1-phosphofructokinase|tara:strand:+ start:26584 stop:27582 length:999 start_codon:yes stop_codon:yes gene_type:complete
LNLEATAPAVIKIRTVTLNPALDLNMFFTQPRLGVLNRETSSYLEASGKGLNVAAALSAQGIISTAIVPLGGPLGEVMRGMLGDVPFELLIVEIEGFSRINTKVTDDNSGEMTEFNGRGGRLEITELTTCSTLIMDGLVAGDTVVLSGSLPPGAPLETYRDLVENIQSQGAKVAVDSSSEPLKLALTAGPDLVKPNQREAEELLGKPLLTFGDAVNAVRNISEQGAKEVILSLGKEGVLFLDARGTMLFTKPPEVQALSTTGCGDALVAGYLFGCQQNWSLQETARYATAMAVGRAKISGPTFPDSRLTEELVRKINVSQINEINFNHKLLD